jgi:hypothetical protein
MSNYSLLGPIERSLLDPFIDQCRSIDWSNDAYQRFEAPLTGGRMLEYPFVMTTRFAYNEQERTILYASEPLLNWIMALPRFADHLWIRGEIGALTPGVTLGWHIDMNRTNDWHAMCTKLHIPLITNADCEEMWEGDAVHMEVGSLYEFNNRVLHTATNQGSETRVHLILALMPKASWPEFVSRVPTKVVRYQQAEGIRCE